MEWKQKTKRHPLLHKIRIMYQSATHYRHSTRFNRPHSSTNKVGSKLWMYRKKGPHTFLNLSEEPFNVCLIFSNFAQCRASLIQWIWDGEAGDFQLSKISLLANRLTKARISLSALENDGIEGNTPNRAPKGVGSTLRPTIDDKELKTSVQYLWREGQSQNVWMRSAGACWHLSHSGETSL